MSRPMNLSLETLRARLITSLGLSLAVVPACSGPVDDNCERDLVDTVYLNADTGATWDHPTNLDDVQLLFDANDV